jgi:hypothetical protein
MTAKNRQQVKILAALLVILAVTWIAGPGINQPASVSAVPPAEQKPSVALPASGDARIRIDLIEKPSEADDAGASNLFQYRNRQASNSAPPQASNPFIVPIEQPPVQPEPQRPPPPPPIPFKYEGYALRKGNSLMAFLTDSTGHYNVTAGEILMGRYRIVNVTEDVVEVEDLDQNRRQSLPRVQP